MELKIKATYAKFWDSDRDDMFLERESLASGEKTTRVLNTKEDDFKEMLIRWGVGGQPFEKVFEKFTEVEREFILTGINEQEWIKLFGKKE